MGEQYGYRNAQTTCIAPTGTIGLVMDCDTTGIEPDFALALTTRKKDSLILNVDGAIGILFLDLMEAIGFTRGEQESLLEHGGLNGLFLLGRTIGMIGHFFDQRRLKEGLYRHPWDDILYHLPREEQL